jgi:hypothetical protein
MVTAKDPATFFHPMGEKVEGARNVQQRYDADAKSPPCRDNIEPIGRSIGTLPQSLS